MMEPYSHDRFQVIHLSHHLCLDFIKEGILLDLPKLQVDYSFPTKVIFLLDLLVIFSHCYLPIPR